MCPKAPHFQIKGLNREPCELTQADDGYPADPVAMPEIPKFPMSISD